MRTWRRRALHRDAPVRIGRIERAIVGQHWLQQTPLFVLFTVPNGGQCIQSVVGVAVVLGARVDLPLVGVQNAAIFQLRQCGTLSEATFRGRAIPGAIGPAGKNGNADRFVTLFALIVNVALERKCAIWRIFTNCMLNLARVGAVYFC